MVIGTVTAIHMLTVPQHWEYMPISQASLFIRGTECVSETNVLKSITITSLVD